MEIEKVYKAANGKKFSHINAALNEDLIYLQEQLPNCDEAKLCEHPNIVAYHINELIKTIKASAQSESLSELEDGYKGTLPNMSRFGDE